LLNLSPASSSSVPGSEAKSSVELFPGDDDVGLLDALTGTVGGGLRRELLSFSGFGDLSDSLIELRTGEASGLELLAPLPLTLSRLVNGTEDEGFEEVEADEVLDGRRC